MIAVYCETKWQF